MAYFWFIAAPILYTLRVVHSVEVEVEFEADDKETYRKYYNYEELRRRLYYLAETHNNICGVMSVGRSAEGRELWVMRITSRPNTDLPGKPRFKFVGNVHGDEAVSRQVLIYLIEYLVTSYGTDPRVTALLNTTDIYIMPTLNPDGFEKATEGECDGNKLGRENAKHVDLNKSFIDQVDPVVLENAPEVTAMTEWILQKRFVLSGNLHGGSVMARYPFDDSSSHAVPPVYSRTADDALFHYLAQSYAENHPIMKEKKSLCPDKPNKHLDSIINGSEWHDNQGSMQDFSYFRGNCFEVVFELSCCKYPSASELYTEWNNNKDALLTYMEKVHIGVRGYVIDTSGLGIPDSVISVAGIDHNITAWKFGDYYRLLLPGTYNITASSPGYISRTICGVTVIEGKATLQNFILRDSKEKLLMPDPSTSVPITAYMATPVFEYQVSSASESPGQRKDFFYHSYSDTVRFLQRISSIYSSVTLLYSIGQSVLGRELYVMEISTNPGIYHPDKPQVMFIGKLQGNDGLGQEILLKLMKYLCSNYGRDPLVTRLVNSTVVHILPSMNPDGYEPAKTVQIYVNENSDSNSGVKYTSQQYASDESYKIKVKPETKALMDWIKTHSFVLSASTLGGMIGMTYPSSADSPDKILFKLMAQAFFMEHSSHQLPQACEEPLDQKQGIDLQDWTYHNTDTLQVSIGLSCNINPSARNFTTHWKQNQRALLHFIQQVHFSVKGRVTDAQSGQGIANATIMVEGSRHRVHSSSTGQYWRPLASGMYHLRVFAPGYTTVTVSVIVSETWMEQVHFTLTPEQPTVFENQKEEEEFRKLVEGLSSVHSLKDFVQNYLPARTLRYRRHAERSEFLRGLHLNFPYITRLYSLGHSWEFRPIWALEISINPESPQPMYPQIRYVAGVHGNAASGPELLLEFASVLCINYGRNPTITQLINRSRIVIVPCVNPDGRELAQMGMCYSTAGLTNAHGVDLDTDFFYGNTSVQPETRAMMKLIEEGGFSLSLALEGGSLLVAYPYDRPTEPAQKEETLKYLASVYATNNPVMHLSYPGCINGPESVSGGILRGAEFNSHTGSMKDFSVDVGLCPEITVYTGCCLYPSAQQLHSLWMEHSTALFAMLLEVHKGLSGVVKDRKGQPVSDAVIRVNGSVFVHTNTQGFFHTLLALGTQQLQIQAQGFQEQFRQVNVSSHQQQISMVIELTVKITPNSQLGVMVAVAVSILALLLCFLLVWYFRSAKFSRIRDSVGWLSSQQDYLHMEAIVSEKLPLQNIFWEESESEDDAFYFEQD